MTLFGKKYMTPSNLEPYGAYVATGDLKAVDNGSLRMYSYTNRCVYKGNWNHWTRTARGIIFERETGKLVLPVMPKAFNINERHETLLPYLPRMPFVVEEKVDGTLCHYLTYNGEQIIATKGSFDSIQIGEAWRILRVQCDLSALPDGITLAMEVIYPENRFDHSKGCLVVDYGDKRELVLLAAFDQESGYELPSAAVDAIATTCGFRRPLVFDCDLESTMDLCGGMDLSQEGFVIRYANNYRVKIKGEAYLKMARLISRLSPLAVWEAMAGGELPDTFVMDYPEELRPELEGIQANLFCHRTRIISEIEQDADALPEQGDLSLRDHRKQVGLFLKDHSSALSHPGAVFSRLLGNTHALEKYIRDTTRPTGNVFGDQ